METIDFYEQTSTTQDRLRWAFLGQFDLKPMLFRPETRAIDLAWLAVSGAAAVTMVALWTVGFGQLEASLARQHPAWMVAYFALGLAFFGGIGAAAAYRVRIRRLPFTPGIYLFGARLVDAREARLRVHPLSALSDVRARGGELVLSFGRRRYSFGMPIEDVERGVTLVQAARARAVQELSRASLCQIDPFATPEIDSPLAPQQAPPAEIPGWTRHVWWVGALLGAAVVGLYFVRDDLSDAQMLARATARDDVAAYRAYLARGDDPGEQVRRVLLPRAALREAISEGSVEAIDDFAAAHPDAEIAEDIEKARRAALVAAFERTKQQATLASLVAFEHKYPNHHLGERIDAAMHGLYLRATGEVQAKMAVGPASEFLPKLVQAAEKIGPKASESGLRGPTVYVRMQQVPSKALGRTDDLVRRHPYYGGSRSLPSQYFEREEIVTLEAAAAESLAASFAKVFPSEIMTFTAGAPVAEDLDAVSAPTLLVRYRVEPSGQNYARPKPKGVFMGVVLFSYLEFLLPDQDEPLESKHMFAQKLPISMIVDHEAGDDPLEPRLYAALMEGAFAELEKRYLGEWFRDPT